MKSDFIKKNFKPSQAKYVEYGYGQVEPNHLSAQRTAQIYAQLPAAAEIEMLEQGQFVKYDYAKGLVNFDGAGEWMLVYNEIKLYRDGQDDCEFAMIKDNYQARVYSPYGADKYTEDRYSRNLVNRDVEGDGWSVKNGVLTIGGSSNVDSVTYPVEGILAPEDPYEIHYNNDPFKILSPYTEAKMPAGTTMVPRVFKTNVGDIMTTNTVNADTLEVGNLLAPNSENGILEVVDETATGMVWQVAKVYTMADHQRGVKIVRIA